MLWSKQHLQRLSSEFKKTVLFREYRSYIFTYTRNATNKSSYFKDPYCWWFRNLVNSPVEELGSCFPPMIYRFFFTSINSNHHQDHLNRVHQVAFCRLNLELGKSQGLRCARLAGDFSPWFEWVDVFCPIEHGGFSNATLWHVSELTGVIHGMFWWLLDFKSCFVPVEFNKKTSYYMLWNMMQYTFFIILERIQSGLDKPNKGSWNCKHLLIKRTAWLNQKVCMFHVFFEAYWYGHRDSYHARIPIDRWVFPKIGVPQNGWFIEENPIKMDDLGGKLLFSETSRWS